jgi:hypothetical protein
LPWEHGQMVSCDPGFLRPAQRTTSFALVFGLDSLCTQPESRMLKEQNQIRLPVLGTEEQETSIHREESGLSKGPLCRHDIRSMQTGRQPSVAQQGPLKTPPSSYKSPNEVEKFPKANLSSLLCPGMMGAGGCHTSIQISPHPCD